MNHQSQAGAVSPLLVASLLLGLLTIVLAGTSVWAYMNYQDQKNNTDEYVAIAVDEAKKEQAAEMQAQFEEQLKQPTKQYNGPSDLGSVSFRYPRTWSGYVAETSNKLEAYFHPNTVPKVTNSQPFAVRVLVEDKQYETVMNSYEQKVKKGDIKSSPVTINGFSGIRLDGQFTNERQGSAVVFKVRDKTLTIASDSTSFANDFNDIILDTVSFNP